MPASPSTPPPPQSTMVSATFAAFAALCVAFIAIEFFPFLDLQSVPSTSMTTQDSTLDSAVEFFPFEVMLPLAATVVLFTAVAFIHLHHGAAATAVGAGNKRLSELLTFIICGTAGILEFFLFVQPAGAVEDFGALARALGRAAFDALPAAATVVFFLGITLVIGHICAGGEGGGGGGDVADNRCVPLSVDVLKKIALGAAAALLSQIAIAALYVK